jgi:ATP-binding cassette, subfamily B, bacterial
MRTSMTAQLRWTLRLVWESGPGWAVAGAAIVAVQAMLPLAALYFTKLIVDAVALTLSEGADFARVLFLIAIAGGIALASALCRALAAFVSEGQSQAVTDHIYDLLHAKAVEADLEYYENSQYHDRLQRALQEAAFRPTHIVNGLIQVLQSAITLAAMAGLLFSFYWGLAVALLAAAIPGIILRARQADQSYRWQRAQTPTERRAWYFHWLLTGIVHAKEIRLFDLGALFRRRFRETRAGVRRERLELSGRRSAADLIGQASLILAVFGSYALIAYRATRGAITLGDLVMYYQAFQRGQEYLRELLNGLAGLYEDHLFVQSVHEFLHLDRKVFESPAAKPVPRPMRAGLVFDRVSFHYPAGARPVLDDVSLTIRPGESVALVGTNGSGKTTLIKLLCRLYDPTSGAITVDGVDIRDFSTRELRREIGVIFQDHAQYQMTAKDNIWLGNTEQEPDLDQIVAAARRSGADPVIRGLPRGYDTFLGKWLEPGEELSIGEWQKVALARAFMRNAQIVVLDEPTSALDARAEYQLFRHFRRLAEGRTTILISHRLSTVKMADHIYVLDAGRIVEGGTHDQLIRAGGHYESMYETQARQYR